MNPSLLLIPDRYKAAKLYSQIPDSGAGDLTFARNSNATRVNSAGLIEKVRTNLLTYSNTFSDAAWTKNNLTLTAGQVDPDGGTNATRAEFSGVSYIFQAPSTAFATASIYVRATSGTANIRIGDSNGNFVVAYALTESWQRITAFGATMAGISIDSFIGGSWTAQDVIIAFAQFETGDIATPYIPTTTAAVSVGITADIPRLDYTGGGCPSLLLEPQRTNLVFFSEQLDNAGWTLSAVVTANTAVSPDGFMNADSVMESAATDYHILGDPVTTVSGTPYTFSFFAKPNGRNFARILFGNGSFPDDKSAYFDLLTGAVSAASPITASMVNYGNGWYRCIATMTSDASASDAVYFGPARNMTDGYATYPGNASLGIYAYGVQQEAGSYVSSYIPTLGASVTRLADAASKTGISSLIGQTEGTLFVEFDATITGNASSYAGIALNNGTSSNILAFGYYQNGRIQAVAFVGGSLLVNIDLPAFALTTGNHKFALSYKLNDYVFYVDGVQVGSDTSATVPATSVLNLYDVVGANMAYSQVALFTTRLTNAELASLTSL
jgi:hypothetical protein